MSRDAYSAFCASWGDIGTTMRAVGWSARCAIASGRIIRREITRGDALIELQDQGVPRQFAKSQTFGSDAIAGPYVSTVRHV